MRPTEGGASAPTRGGRRCGSEDKLFRKPMRSSSTPSGAFNSCRLKQSAARAAAVAVGLVFLQLQCSGGASTSSLAPHLATAAPLTTPSTDDSSRSAEFVGWRGRRRQGSTGSRILLAGTVGLVADRPAKFGDAGREGEWRRCRASDQQHLFVEGVNDSTRACSRSRVAFVLGSALSLRGAHAAVEVTAAFGIAYLSRC